MPNEENDQVGESGGEAEMLGAFSPDYFGSDGELFGTGIPERIVVKGKRLPRPFGGMSSLPILFSVALPSELLGGASLAQYLSNGHMDDPCDQANAAAGAAAFREQHSNAVNSQTGQSPPSSYFAIIQC